MGIENKIPRSTLGVLIFRTINDKTEVGAECPPSRGHSGQYEATEGGKEGAWPKEVDFQTKSTPRRVGMGMRWTSGLHFSRCGLFFGGGGCPRPFRRGVGDDVAMGEVHGAPLVAAKLQPHLLAGCQPATGQGTQWREEGRQGRSPDLREGRRKMRHPPFENGEDVNPANQGDNIQRIFPFAKKTTKILAGLAGKALTIGIVRHPPKDNGDLD